MNTSPGSTDSKTSSASADRYITFDGSNSGSFPVSSEVVLERACSPRRLENCSPKLLFISAFGPKHAAPHRRHGSRLHTLGPFSWEFKSSYIKYGVYVLDVSAKKVPRGAPATAPGGSVTRAGDIPRTSRRLSAIGFLIALFLRVVPASSQLKSSLRSPPTTASRNGRCDCLFAATHIVICRDKPPCSPFVICAS